MRPAGPLSDVSRFELEEPASWVAGVAAIAFAWGGLAALNPLFYISPSFIAILVGFAVHEAAHKFVAIRYGGVAGFVAYGPGLLITFLSGFIPGIAILAPGYVRVATWSEKAAFYSVVAGPASNILISIASLALLLGEAPLGPLDRYLLELAELNAYLAFFNLLPIPPLDGSKIIKGSLWTWAFMMGLSIMLLLS